MRVTVLGLGLIWVFGAGDDFHHIQLNHSGGQALPFGTKNTHLSVDTALL